MGNGHAICRLALIPAHWSASRQLSAIGHPGYSEAFAERVLARVLIGESPHAAVAAEQHSLNQTKGK